MGSLKETYLSTLVKLLAVAFSLDKCLSRNVLLSSEGQRRIKTDSHVAGDRIRKESGL